MEDNTKSVLEIVLAGIADRAAIVAAVWLVKVQILPADQEVTAEHLIAVGLVGLGTVAFVWWREHAVVCFWCGYCWRVSRHHR